MYNNRIVVRRVYFKCAQKYARVTRKRKLQWRKLTCKQLLWYIWLNSIVNSTV